MGQWLVLGFKAHGIGIHNVLVLGQWSGIGTVIVVL